MKQLGKLLVINHSPQRVVDHLIAEFNIMSRGNKSVEFLDLHISPYPFARHCGILIYTYNDPLLDPEQEFDNGNSVVIGVKPTHIGMMPGLDPSDPDWREKQALWEASRNVQEARGRTETQES